MYLNCDEIGVDVTVRCVVMRSEMLVYLSLARSAKKNLLLHCYATACAGNCWSSPYEVMTEK